MFIQTLTALAVGCAAVFCVGSGALAEVKAVGPVTVVSHVDVIPDAYIPNNEEKAQECFKDQIAASKSDKGLVSYNVLQETGGGNHFTIVERWADVKDFAAHEGTAHTIKFRTDIQPTLGSPFDQRIHIEFK